MSKPWPAATNALASPLFSSLGREAEVRRLGLAARHRDSGRLRAVLLVPRLDGVGPGRQAREREAPVRAAHRKERMGQHTQPRVHPAVHVALERHHDLGFVERLARGHDGGLADVEGAVGFRLRLDVVQDAVGVLDRERLAYLDAEYVRMVAAAVLIEGHRPRGRGRLVARRETGLYVYEHIRERAV